MLPEIFKAYRTTILERNKELENQSTKCCSRIMLLKFGEEIMAIGVATSKKILGIFQTTLQIIRVEPPS